MRGIHGEYVLEGRRRIRAVVLLQKQLADLDARPRVGGIGADRLVVSAERVFVQLGIFHS